MDTSNLKRSVLEPKIYALMVKSPQGQVLHMGVHFTLEEAFSAARARLNALSPHQTGESLDIDLWNSIPARQVIAQFMDPLKVEHPFPSVPQGTPQEPVDNTIDPVQVGNLGIAGKPIFLGALPVSEIDKIPGILQDLLKKTVKDIPVDEYLQDIKDVKNLLMKKLITEGDRTQVEKAKGVLGGHAYHYVLKEIEKRNSVK